LKKSRDSTSSPSHDDPLQEDLTIEELIASCDRKSKRHTNFGVPHESDLRHLRPKGQPGIGSGKTGWTFQSKVVAPLDHKRILQLAAGTRDEALFKELCRLLDDENLYLAAGVKAKRQNQARAKCSVSQRGWEEYRDSGYARVLESEARGFGRLFVVAEHEKKRFRFILHTMCVNDAIAAQHFKLPHIEELQDAMKEAEFGVTFDMASWYNQFVLSESVRTFYAFERGGNLWAPTRLPMGMRRSCELAQMATKIITRRASKYARTFVYLDNVLFLGTHAGTSKAAEVFIEDARTVGASINDGAKIEITREPIFVGLKMNLVEKTSLPTSKVLAKEKILWDNKSRWSNADMSAFLSTTWFIQRVKGISKTAAFDALNVWRRLHKKMQQRNDEAWPLPAVLSESDANVLAQWRDYTLHSPPKPFTQEVALPGSEHVLIATDASRDGWGAFTVRESGCTVMAGKMNSMKASVDSEPFGCYAALSRTSVPRGSKITVLSDNKPLVDAFKRGYSARWAINRAIALIEEFARKNSLEINLLHIPGAINPADGPSRNRAITEDETQNFKNWLTGHPVLAAWDVRVSGPPRLVLVSPDPCGMDLNNNTSAFLTGSV